MKILIVCRYKENFSTHITPFVSEQGSEIAKLGIEIDYFTIRGNYIKSVYALNQKIKQFKPDVIHAHYGLSGLTSVLQRKVPVVVTFHNGETLSKLVNVISSFASLFAKYRIYVAQHIYDLCVFKRNKNYTILPCGVDVNVDELTKDLARKELSLKKEKKYILFGGAFSNLRKNYPLLKQAVDLLNRNDIEIIEMCGLTREKITKLLFACDLFALPTKSEGSPQALKEAMICNCPIVATNVADIKHLLGDLEGHYICSFKPEDIADKINKALDFPNRTNGRKRIIELGLDSRIVAQKIVDIYNKVLDNK
jgi:glycosyltransferase involved in cell wall biosynthesis